MAVCEVAQLAIDEDRRDEFESVVRANLTILKEADGCLDVKLLPAIDAKAAFVLLLKQQSLEHHTEIFTNSEGFNELAGAVRPSEVSARVLHAAIVNDGFGPKDSGARQDPVSRSLSS